MSFIPFGPIWAGSKTISATTSSSAVTLGFQSNQLLITNTSATIPVYVTAATSGATAATTTSMCINPFESRVITKPRDYLSVAAITASGSATVVITPGEGF